MIYRIYTVSAGGLNKWGSKRKHGHLTLNEAKSTLLDLKVKWPKQFMSQQFVIQEHLASYKAKIVYITPEIKIVNNGNV